MYFNICLSLSFSFLLAQGALNNDNKYNKKATKIVEILWEYYKEGQFATNHTMMLLPVANINNEKKKFNDCVNLLEYIMTGDDWRMLMVQDIEEDKLLRSTDNIEERTMRHMLFLEGKKKKGGETATWKAIGRQIGELRSKGLIGVGGKGTPEGYTSMNSFCKK